MPLNKKGAEIKKSMEGFYGKKAGDRVFYSSENSGKIKNVTESGCGNMMEAKKAEFARKMQERHG